MPATITRTTLVSKPAAIYTNRRVKASETIGFCDVVLVDANGESAQVVAVNTLIGVAAVNAPLYLSQTVHTSAASGDLGDLIAVKPNETEIVLPLTNGTATAQTWANTYIGKTCDIRRGSSTFGYSADVATINGANAKLMIVGVDEATKNDAAVFVRCVPVEVNVDGIRTWGS